MSTTRLPFTVALLCSEAMAADRPVRLTLSATSPPLQGIPSRARSRPPDYHLLVTVAGQEVDVYEVGSAERL